MDYTSWQEIQKNEVVRKRLAKRIVRECFRDGEFENFHSRSAELDDDAVKEIMTDAVNRTHIFLSKLSNAMGDLIAVSLREARFQDGWRSGLWPAPEPGPTKTPVFMHSGCEPHDGPSAVQKQAQAIFSDVQSIHPASTAG
jgi:hypothetical protein